MVKLLLSSEQGDEINSMVEGCNPFSIACQNRPTEIASLLLEHGADPVAACGEVQWSPLSIACVEGRYEVTLILLNNKKVDVTLADYKNRNCLRLALVISRKEIVSLIFSTLLGNREDTLKPLVKIEDFFGRNTFDYIVANFAKRPNDILRSLIS